MKFEIGEMNVICSDIDRSLNFYVDILGFEIIEQEDTSFRLKSASHIILLLPVARSGASERFEYCSRPEISFDIITDNLKEAENYFISADVKFLKPFSENESYFVIGDPDGLAVEVIQK